jgi:hypothetical protein
VTDPVSFLWRSGLAGNPRDVDAWRLMHDFATGAFPRAGVAFSDMHIALAEAVAGNETALEARERHIDELARNGRYPSGPLIPVMQDELNEAITALGVALRITRCKRVLAGRRRCHGAFQRRGRTAP